MASWIGSIVGIILLVAAGVGHARAGYPVDVLVLDRADATVSKSGFPAFDVRGLKLSHRWDTQAPVADGTAIYHMDLPASAPNVPYGLFISRVGNQVEVDIAGQAVARLGKLGDPRTDSAKAPLWIDLPAALLSAERPTPIEIRISAQSGRWGGLSPVLFGPVEVLKPIYARNYAWRQTATVVIVLSLVLMGLLAGGLWWQQRDPSYGLLALTALFGVVRMGDRIVVEPPLPWPVWGSLTAVAFVVHLMLMARFTLLQTDIQARWVRQGFWGTIVVCSCAAIVSFQFHEPRIWTIALALFVIPGVVVLASISREAFRSRERNAILLCGASFVVTLAGFRDLVAVRLLGSGVDNFSLLPHAVFLFVLFMGWIVVERYSLQVREYRELNATLATRIAQRERELMDTQAVIQRQAQERATMEERQRIMRDIHDGVGAHLVSLLSLAGRSDPQKAELQAEIGAALDELRAAVDSLQPVHGDLSTVLATLRYRLQPRLQDAGLEVMWDVEALPVLDGLQPGKVLQIYKLLLEAFTNVIRHSNAARIQVSARAVKQPPSLEIGVADDGVGFDPAAHRPRGVGLSSMRSRAEGIGASLSIDATPGKGTRIRLILPLLKAPES